MNTYTRRFNAHLLYSLKNNRFFNKLLLYLLILSILWFCYTMVNSRFIPVAISFAESYAKRNANIIINQSVQEVMSRDNIKYSDLYSIEKDSNGQISSLVSNTIKINQIKSEITCLIQDKVYSLNSQNIGIPIGNLTNSYLLTGRGYKIPVKILTVGEVAVGIENSFVSCGINQTKHEVILNANVDIVAILPLGRTTTNVTTAIPMTDAIIVGDVPNTYLNIGK